MHECLVAVGQRVSLIRTTGVSDSGCFMGSVFPRMRVPSVYKFFTHACHISLRPVQNGDEGSDCCHKDLPVSILSDVSVKQLFVPTGKIKLLL